MKEHELHKSLTQLNELHKRLDRIRQELDKETDNITAEPEGDYFTHAAKTMLHNDLITMQLTLDRHLEEIDKRREEIRAELQRL